jgi:hypothetical protein
MTSYNVHIYREMRLFFPGIEADSHEAAAEKARDLLTADAEEIDDCDGESLSALVDVEGDDDYALSRCIDFEAERLRKAAAELREALQEIVAAADNNASHQEKTKSGENQKRLWLWVADRSRTALAQVEGGGP